MKMLNINFAHKWIFDWPWELVDLKDWFYMVNTGHLGSLYCLHVRIFGIRSLWEVWSENENQ